MSTKTAIAIIQARRAEEAARRLAEAIARLMKTGVGIAA